VFALLVLLSVAQDQVAAQQSMDMLIRAEVRRVLGARAFTLADRLAADGEVFVLAPEGQAPPSPGTTVLVQGRLRRLADVELAAGGDWTDIVEPIRKTLADRLILDALSVTTDTGRRQTSTASVERLEGAQPVPAVEPLGGAQPPAQVGGSTAQQRRAPATSARDAFELKIHPATLGELIHALGGQRVTLPNARVIAVINPRAFLIESSSSLSPLVGNLDRLLVLVDEGALRVEAAALVGSDVRVRGRARTLLGIQTTGEVPWPAALTRDVVDRLEIRAAVLASSVQTTDGVELTNREPLAPADAR
jgi:hypothetical protein